MSRRDRRLLALVAIELVAGAVLYFRRPEAPPTPPPVPDLSDADPALAAHVREKAAACRTPDDWAALGLVYISFGYFPEAEACYRVAAEREAERPDRQHDWAFALERMGRPREANAAYERAAALGHGDPGGCWYFVGRNHLRLEDGAAARAAFEKSGQPQARYELAVLLARDGRGAEALPVLDQLSSQFPDAVQPPLLRHRVERLSGQSGAASADRALRVAGRLPTPFDREFRRLEAGREQLGTVKDLREARRLIAAGNAAAAEPLLANLARTAWAPEVADLSAEVEFLRNRPGEAARVLQEAIDRAGGSVYLFERLGDAHAEAGRPADAVAAWQRAVALGGAIDAKNTHYKLALHFDKAGNAAAAAPHHARAYLGAGHELLAAGQLRDAKGPLDKGLKYGPQFPPLWFARGEVQRLSGQVDVARAAYRKCLEIDPDHGRAAAALELLSGK